MDKRAGELNAEYLAKAKHTDQTYCGTPRDTVGPVELKLGSLGRVHGIVVGAFGEASDDLHSLIHHLAVSRVRFAGPQVGRRGQVRTEEAEIALTTSLLRKSLSVCAVRRQACSPLIQLFFGFASDIDQTNINRDIRDGNWLSIQMRPIPGFINLM